MKACTFLAACLCLTATLALAQRTDQRGSRDRGGPPPDPLLQLFDTNRDGELSASEIDAAPDVLRGFDRNGDGVLAREELPRPGPPPARDGRRGVPSERDGSESPIDRDSREQNAAPGTVTIRGGHETDTRDHGRPVILIAAALGVKEEVFRDAFSNVRPERGPGGPSPERAQANKKVLMDALGKYGVTNDRLDEVSNYYRYRPQSGELWKHSPASARAVIENGELVRLEIINSGSGYSSPPNVQVAGYPDVQVETTLGFDRSFEKNGRITELRLKK